ncbi:DNA-processing protein DprA [Paludicola sp. MB14-C6]|uniref:DNA-processing protein DprA n=1 Tax=Paludihabitans sp. MB14-C6 TaxID=3070656 RepID=UPI0027DBD842|nr:DNA-processing protein DprA [Paludicola sp. MB14-C6]WMJ23689.1 DNA-processing protein DprA [Paludicola sp. MB14-C6]
MDEKLYWVWLSLIFNYGNDKPNEILMRYESPEDFYHLTTEQMLELGFLSEKDVKAIKGVSLLRAEKVIKDCKKHQIEIVTIGDNLYPERLKLIYGPPIVLYVQGDILGIDENVAITIVGTRKSSEYTSYATQYLSYHLAQAGAIIVSGCAVGIDTDAHIGALRANARTIAVLGCGLDINYPAENKELKEQILKKGALISELPPGEAATGKIFPIRNRILAGLSLGVLVTHAPERSGSLITVEHAIEQGKDVFCLPPYSIFDPQYAGVIKYLRDGATPVFSVKDILIEYYSTYAHKLDVDKIIGDYILEKRLEGRPAKIRVPKQSEEQPIPKLDKQEQEKILEEYKHANGEIIMSLDEKQILVYNKLTLEPKFIDELSSECNLDVGTILSVLTEFEIMGIVSSYSGRRYALAQ